MKAPNYAFALLSTSLLFACAPPNDEVGSGGLDTAGTTGIFGTTGSSSGSTSTGIGDPDGDGNFTTPGFDLAGDPYYARAIPLTNAQWTASVKYVLNLQTDPTQANSFLSPVGGFHLFTNNEAVLEVSNNLRESYQLAAAEIAEDLDAAAISRIGGGTTADSFVRTVGRRAFRRPLTEAEVTAYKALFDVGVTLSGDQSDFEKGASLVVEGFLQSPNFLYRTELEPASQPLTGFEMAAKLSYWLLQKAPTEELLDRAENGELDTPAGIASVVDEMLADPAAEAMIVALYAELFTFTRYLDVIKDDPNFSPADAQEMDQVARLFFKRIFSEDMGLTEILTSTEGYVGPELANYYGITPAPATPTLKDLGPSRAGFFSQIPYLSIFGDGNQSDAIHRGVTLNHKLLCAELPIPNFVVPPLNSPAPNQSSRERIEEQTGFGTCGESCHGGYINPLGYAFENFDGIGRERELDNGQPVDTKSAYPFANDVMTEFAGAPELMQILSENEMAHGCFVKGLASFGLQRDVVEDDQALLTALTQVSMSDGSIKDILRELAKSPEFRARPGAI